jgi:DNA replication protein DnaD
MNHGAAMEILDFMEKYSEHFKEFRSFIYEKQEKVAGDDLVWLLDSLATEQKLIMRGNSLEAKRKLIFEEHGIEGYNAKQLYQACPEEVKGRMKLATDEIDENVNYIKEINQDALELARRKLEAQAQILNDSLIAGSDTYDNSGSKTKKLSGYDNNNLGSV